jgi:hypothetical protein
MLNLHGLPVILQCACPLTTRLSSFSAGLIERSELKTVFTSMLNRILWKGLHHSLKLEAFPTTFSTLMVSFSWLGGTITPRTCTCITLQKEPGKSRPSSLFNAENLKFQPINIVIYLYEIHEIFHLFHMSTVEWTCVEARPFNIKP